MTETLSTALDSAWAAMRVIENTMVRATGLPDVRREIAVVRDALNALEAALREGRS